jgi:hypothetical protein
MDIQVLNQIANQVRQASLSQVGAPVSANSQLKALKGNPVPAPGNPAPPSFKDSPEQIQEPVSPEISSVARAASAYSAAVGDGLNSDELNAIQDLGGKVRTAVSDFLNQPGLEQAENVEAVVTSNPEAVQDLASNVEQAVVETLNLPKVEGEVIANAVPPNEELLEEIPVSENFISLERITRGAEPNSSVVAASPAVVNSRASENASVENPVTVEEAPKTSSGDFRVTPSSLKLENANAQSPVEKPVNTGNAPEFSTGDFRVTATSPAVQNAQVEENVPVETPVSRTVAIPPREPVSQPETVAATPQEAPVVRPDVVSPDNQGSPVTAATPAVPNAQASENVPVETPVSRADVAPPQEPVSRPETVVATPQEVSVGRSDAVSPDNQGSPVTAASPSVPNAQVSENVSVETPVSRADVAPPRELVSRAVASSSQESVSRPEAVAAAPQEVPVGRSDAVSSNNQVPPAPAARPALQNVQAQSAGVGSPGNIPAPPVDQGQRPEVPPVQTAQPEGAVTLPEEASSQTASSPSKPQAALGPQPVSAHSNDLFAQENAAVNPENIRDVNELVNSVVDNEFTSEAKKIFSEPKVIRTVADLADFILERLQEIIAANQNLQQSQSSGETGLS